VTNVLPNDVKYFQMIDDVMVVSVEFAIQIA
jgi:hypothetical protein